MVSIAAGSPPRSPWAAAIIASIRRWVAGSAAAGPLGVSRKPVPGTPKREGPAVDMDDQTPRVEQDRPHRPALDCREQFRLGEIRRGDPIGQPQGLQIMRRDQRQQLKLVRLAEAAHVLRRAPSSSVDRPVAMAGPVKKAI